MPTTTKLTDKQIAQRVLDIIDEHEKSWHEGDFEYTKGHWWTNNVYPFLATQDHSAFAITLIRFSQGYYNDVQALCEDIIEML